MCVFHLKEVLVFQMLNFFQTWLESAFDQH